MTDRSGIFAGDDPFALTQNWLDEAAAQEPNDANAIALASVDAEGRPNVRMVLLKEIEKDAFVFYTNYESAKGQELNGQPQAAFVMHWKSLRRQVRVRGEVTKVEGPQADAYFDSRSLRSRIGAIASDQSRPLESRETLIAKADAVGAELGDAPKRPENWGGYRIVPYEIEFWADGAFRLHDRFRWSRTGKDEKWKVSRLFP